MDTLKTVYYHYTTVAGAHSIIRSRRVWLTDYRFLNDKLELRQGYSHFVAAIPQPLRSSFESAFRWHDQFNHHCVLSLSRSPKILSQWRTYAGDGSGFALGFREEFLKFAKIELIPCQYESHESFAPKLVEKHLTFLEEICSARTDCIAENDFMGWIRDHRENFYSVVRDLIALKNPAFAEEQELRAVRCIEHAKVQTRVSGGVIVPYVEANFWRDDERLSDMAVVMPEIWLGPKCNELNRTAIWSIYLGFCDVQRYDCGYV